MMTIHRFLLICVLFLLSPSQGQQYDGGYDQDYAQDSLYHDYAMRQQEKEAAAAGYVFLGRDCTTRKIHVAYHVDDDGAIMMVLL